MKRIQQLEDRHSGAVECRSASTAGAHLHQPLLQWNQTKANYPADCCVHNLFEQQATRTPDRVAVCFEGDQLTYSELNARANQVANYLIRSGVGPEVLVGISLERSLELLVGLLGILKAGGAYVPLDPAYPTERLKFMLGDSRLKLLLSEKELITELPPHTGRAILLDDCDLIASESRENPATKTIATNLAYVLYTSGSTGKPKGVQIEHRSVVNFLTSMRQKPGLAADDVLVAVTTLSFDIAGLELYLPLTVGARVVIASRRVACDSEQLLATIEQSGVTVMQATPITWRLLLDAGWRSSNLKCICGGEALPRDLARQLVKRSPSVWNLYGPTETTIWSSIYKVGDDDTAIIPVGRPIANTQIYILDSALQPVPIGEVGELHIGGDGLARGYLNRPELTAEKFIANPFRVGTRLYKTGDLGRYLPGGDIEFLGRLDHQVKIRGFRIELGEIEAALEEQPGVRQAVVVARDGEAGNTQLVAYFVPRKAAEQATRELCDALKERLPGYMIPAIFVRLEAMPLTANGKVDRKALPNPQLRPAASRSDVIHPSDEYEKRLIAIWEGMFQTQPVSTHDNFWELGGHSLLAARLMHEIEQVFGKRLPLAVLLQAPTIEGLAAVLRCDGFLPVWSSLVPIQPNGSQLPFFCVHGVGGNVVGLQPLARHLGPDQPFYGLQAQGLDGRHHCHTRVEEMAAHYIHEMRTIQPHGPYLIGGVSFGGWVALEMAIQLQHENQEVALVALLASNPGHLRPVTSSLADIFFSPTKHKLMYILPEAIKGSIRRKVVFWSVPKMLRDVHRACAKAERDYHLRPYSGRIALFRPSTTLLRGFKDPQEGWSRFAVGGLEVHEIAGHHVGIITEPHVRSLSEKLAACLRRARRQ